MPVSCSRLRMPRRRRIAWPMRLGRAVAGAACLVAGCVSLAAAQILPSAHFADVTVDWSTFHRYADESDNYHLTWSADDRLYGAYGDGWGFVPTDVSKRSIGVSRIAGTWPQLEGRDVWEGGSQGGACCWAPWNGKSWGMVAVGTELHMWFTIGRPRALGFTEARLASSSDGGRSWRKADWAFGPTDGVLMPTFMQLGRGYTADELPPGIVDYAYSYYTRYVAHPGEYQTPGLVMLMRAPKHRLDERATYQFYAGTTPEGAPIWTADPRASGPVLQRPYLLDVAPSVAWNPHLGRFLMVMAHLPDGDPGGRGVAFYDAPTPWGPWTVIRSYDRFAEGTVFFYQLPTKWMAADGSAVLAFSGTDATREWDALNTVRVRFVTRNPAP